MTGALDQVIGGLAIGFIYALIALGFTILLKSLDLFNFAQGEMITIGAFLGLYTAQRLHLPYLVILVLITAVMGLFGLLLERVVYRPLVRRRTPLINLIILTIALSTVLRNLAIVVGGGEPSAFPNIYPSGRVAILGVYVSSLHLLVTGLGFLYAVGLWWFFYKTKLGVGLRAASEDLETSRLMGISPNTVVSYSFALSAALGGAAGVLLGPLFFVSHELGDVGHKGLIASSLGGLYSLGGGLWGGIGLGVVETVSAGSISSAWKDFIAFGVLIVVLLVMSLGLAGRRRAA